MAKRSVKYERTRGGNKTAKTGVPYNRAELEKVYDLYVELGGKGIHERNPRIHDLAEILDRDVRSVENQLLGFKNVDTGKVGRENYNKLVKAIWEEHKSQSNDGRKSSKSDKPIVEFDEFEFRISSEIKNILGRNLITDDFVAIYELVKNSFDAHAQKVKIIFEKGKIVIWDDGKGMNRRDIINKWLFIAYSAKSDGTEDIEFTEDKNSSYRDRINPNRKYAGEKGIGRLASDRLGSFLTMTTRKIGDDIYWNLKFDWDKYEQNAKKQFTDISVQHSESMKTSFTGFDHGVILEISKLRTVWNRKKILDLKRSLGKLINPFSIENDFEIEFISEKDKNKDIEIAQQKEFSKAEIVNGKVENFIFESLNISTTQIRTTITENETLVETQLIDRGNLIYKIEEPNKFRYIPNGTTITLFYLNHGAKSRFTRFMGMTAAEFGSIFLFNNGFRVLPFGEPSNDPFGINKRKAQGHSRYLGSRELIGSVVISESTEQFKETSSRDGGLVESSGTKELEKFTLETLIKLEKFITPILWKIKGRTGDEDELLDPKAKSQILDFVNKISGGKNIRLLEYSDQLVKYIEDNTSENQLPMLEKLKEIVEKSGDKSSLKKIEQIEQKFLAEVRKREAAERNAAQAEEETKKVKEDLKQVESENSFLKSITSQEHEVILSFMHSIGISANMMDNYLSSIYQKLRRGIPIDERQFKTSIEAIALESRKIISITRYATKANFKVYAEEGSFEIVNFITEYLNNILKPLRGEEIEISISNPDEIKFIADFKPIELNLIIDNLISNSIRAGSKNFNLYFKEKVDEYLDIIFSDDGTGIPESNIKKVFEFGFTTTSGSGLGLFHVKKVLDDLNWELKIQNGKENGVEIKIRINY